MYRSDQAYTNSREKRKSARYALYTCKATQGKKERDRERVLHEVQGIR